MSGTCNDGSSYSYAVGEVQSGEPLGGANGTSKFAFTYGFVEANAKMPCGDGFQSGFWLATAREGGIPELDIAEYWYNMTQWGYHNGQEMNQAVHWQNPSTGANNQDYILYQSGTTRWCDAFHVWGIDWESDHVTWYVDGVATKTITATNEIPAEAMYPILNFDIITNATCSGCGPDSTTPWPGQFQVDYVRVWQH